MKTKKNLANKFLKEKILNGYSSILKIEED